MIPPTKRFDIFSHLTDEACSEGLDAFRFFFKQLHDMSKILSGCCIINGIHTYIIYLVGSQVRTNAN